MSNQFKIILICNDPFYIGLFKGYFHDYRFQFEVNEKANNQNILSLIDIVQPDLIFLDFSLAQTCLLNDRGESLGKVVQDNNITICGLSRMNSKLDLANKLTIKFDKILDEPLNVIDLKSYMQSSFSDKSSSFIEKRAVERRNTIDRRLERSQAITKDISSEEQRNHPQENEMLFQSVVGTFQINHRLKCIILNGKAIDLTCKEFLLFEKLASDTGRVFSTEEIIQHLWPGLSNATKADLHQYAHLLRKKIEIDPKDPQLILNIKGFGYRLAAHSVKEKANSQLNNEAHRESILGAL